MGFFSPSRRDELDQRHVVQKRRSKSLDARLGIRVFNRSMQRTIPTVYAKHLRGVLTQVELRDICRPSGTARKNPSLRDGAKRVSLGARVLSLILTPLPSLPSSRTP